MESTCTHNHIERVAFQMAIRFEILMVVKMIMFFWVVTPHKIIDRYQHFGKEVTAASNSINV